MALVNYLALEQPLIERLKEEVAHVNGHVFSVKDLAGVRQKAQRVPAIHVVYDGDDVLTGKHDRAGHGARMTTAETEYRSKQRVRQRWLVVTVVRNAAGELETGEAVRQSAGLIIQRTIEVLQGWQPLTRHKPFIRQPGPKPAYIDTFAYFPLLFTSEVMTP